jgi:hypothetical protein
VRTPNKHAEVGRSVTLTAPAVAGSAPVGSRAGHRRTKLYPAERDRGRSSTFLTYFPRGMVSLLRAAYLDELPAAADTTMKILEMMPSEPEPG